MTYVSIVEMTASTALVRRVAACAADEGLQGNPEAWANQNIWAIVSADSGWSAAWDYARAAGNATNFNPDTGARSDVIDDNMILAVVQPLVLAMNPVSAPQTQFLPGPDPGTGQGPEDLEEAPS
jgi:hypothetical protein